MTLGLAANLWRASADPAQIEDVILNLAVNARDAMPNGGDITVETADVDVDDAFSQQHPAVPAGQYAAQALKAAISDP